MRVMTQFLMTIGLAKGMCGKMYKCPICNYTTNTIWGLKSHITKSHTFDRCPACGQAINGKSDIRLKEGLLTHLWNNKNDPQHRLWWFLLRSSHNNRKTFDDQIRGLLSV
ncbi:unknown [Betafusellovirus yellowstonense]|uniref:C2H2-type domain-containing protein n=1 Tax=Betafusellovirus yellowstonense TaxID=693629 RepID=D1GFA4_9VIRU|nr:zinc-finger domain protein [Acidianus spindle-shaped virus 1]ACZ35805.1 unknown [Acidianus spindle-shaped virus 1]